MGRVQNLWYTNDLGVILDVVIREARNVDAEDESVRITALGLVSSGLSTRPFAAASKLYPAASPSYASPGSNVECTKAAGRGEATWGYSRWTICKTVYQIMRRKGPVGKD